MFSIHLEIYATVVRSAPEELLSESAPQALEAAESGRAVPKITVQPTGRQPTLMPLIGRELVHDAECSAVSGVLR
jgi:hypothetical protein